jgi:hypothetical protein
VSAEEPFLATFRKSRDPLKQYDVVEKYVRDCTSRQEKPSDDAMRVFRESFELRAERLSANRSATAALYWIIAARIARLAGEARCADGALDLFRHDVELRAIFDLLVIASWRPAPKIGRIACWNCFPPCPCPPATRLPRD